MISINGTLAVQLIHFLLLLFILNRLMLQPLLKLIREREEYQNRTKREIRELEAKIGQLQEEFVSQETGARRDAAAERSEIMNEGISESDGYLSESREQVSSLREQAERDVEAELSKTRPELEGQAMTLVEGIMEKIIGRRVEA